MDTLVSIITINYNGLADTCELIDSIPFSSTVEMIVVDNGSQADEASAIERRYPHVTVVRSDTNLGFAGGNNLGIKAAHGKYLFLVNNDAVLGREKGEGNSEKSAFALQPLIDRLERSPKIAVVCPKIRFSWNERPIQFAGYTPLSPVTLRNRAIGCGEADEGQYDEACPTPYAHGAAMMIKREALDRVGLMPECYFLYYEELDWSMMFNRAGYEIWYEPGCTVYHKESRTTGQGGPLRTFYITRNRLLFAQRNVGMPVRLFTYLYLLIGVAGRDICKFAFHRQGEHCRAVCRGIWQFIVHGSSFTVHRSQFT